MRLGVTLAVACAIILGAGRAGAEPGLSTERLYWYRLQRVTLRDSDGGSISGGLRILALDWEDRQQVLFRTDSAAGGSSLDAILYLDEEMRSLVIENEAAGKTSRSEIALAPLVGAEDASGREALRLDLMRRSIPPARLVAPSGSGIAAAKSLRAVNLSTLETGRLLASGTSFSVPPYVSIIPIFVVFLAAATFAVAKKPSRGLTGAWFAIASAVAASVLVLLLVPMDGEVFLANWGAADPGDHFTGTLSLQGAAQDRLGAGMSFCILRGSGERAIDLTRVGFLLDCEGVRFSRPPAVILDHGRMLIEAHGVITGWLVK